MKLTILAFLYCGEFLKNSWRLGIFLSDFLPYDLNTEIVKLAKGRSDQHDFTLLNQ